MNMINARRSTLAQAAFAAAFALLFATHARPAAAQDATVAIGALTLTYPAADWAVEGSTIRCVSERCLGAIVAFTVTENPEFCTRDVGYGRAAEVFPGADRHAVNGHAIGNLALVFGQSGPPFDNEVGRAVYACVTRDGLRHEFMTRLGDEPIPVYQDGAIFELLAGGLAADPHGERVLDLGGLEIAFDGDVFELVTQLGEPGDGAAMLECLPPFCREPATVVVNARPLEEGGCFPDRQVNEGQYTEIEIGEGVPTVTLETIHSMCRAMSPPSLTACVAHNGTRYMVGTLVDLGCYFGPFVPDDLFVQFVRGIRLSE